MPSLPNPIRRGQVITAEWLNQLREVVQCIYPRTGPDIGISESSGGTTFKLLRPKMVGGDVARLHPFQLYVGGGTGDSAWRTVRVNVGYINDCPPAGTDADATPTNIVVPASTSNFKIWLDCDVDTTTGVLTGRALDDGATGWSGYPDQPEGVDGALPDKLYVLLGEVTTGNDTAKTITINQAVEVNLGAGAMITDETCSAENGITLTRQMKVWGR